mmetsp:Transcript_62548/g.204129  ORF Transcript_62548/g.204129 Transcript_62548/m.204129 type:complete len:204 (+) Transcript_62548:1908-2519(+)
MCDGRRGGPGRQGGVGGRLRQELASRLGHRGRRCRHLALGWPEAARGHRPGVAEGSAPAHLGRGNLRLGLCLGAASAGSHAATDAGTYDPYYCAPPLHGAVGRSHCRFGAGRGARGWHTCRALEQKRSLCEIRAATRRRRAFLSQGSICIESGSARCEFAGVGIVQISFRICTGVEMMSSAFASGVLDLGIVKEGRFVVKLGN